MINCNTCAKLIPDDSEFCPFCGNKIIHMMQEPFLQGVPLSVLQLDALIKRAFLFLEEGAFDKADNYVEAVLNQDPENAEAYLIKLMIDLRVSIIEEIANVDEPLDNNINYKRALRYGDEKIKEKLLKLRGDSIVSIKRKNDRIYSEAMSLMSMDTIDNYKNAITLFESIPTYKDSAEKISLCKNRINELSEKESNIVSVILGIMITSILIIGFVIAVSL